MPPSTEPSPAERRAVVALSAALSGWLLATLASQHPHRSFDRLRAYDAFGMLLPNWRFFAPEPAQHDFHVLHRVLGADGVQSPWRESSTIAPRGVRQMLLFPDRRREKGIFDVSSELLRLMGNPRLDLTRTVPYEALRNAVERRVRAEQGSGPAPEGFQFLIARGPGHDEEEEPEYLLASPFVPLDPAG